MVLITITFVHGKVCKGVMCLKLELLIPNPDQQV